MNQTHPPFPPGASGVQSPLQQGGYNGNMNQGYNNNVNAGYYGHSNMIYQQNMNPNMMTSDMMNQPINNMAQGSMMSQSGVGMNNGMMNSGVMSSDQQQGYYMNQGMPQGNQQAMVNNVMMNPNQQMMMYQQSMMNQQNNMMQGSMMSSMPPVVMNHGMVNQNQGAIMHQDHQAMMNPNQSGMIDQQQQTNNNNVNGSMMSNNSNVIGRNPSTPHRAPSQPQVAPQNNRGGLMGSRLTRPAFVDPATNIMYETDQAEYEGWLTKQSMWLKDWRRRYVILKGNKLFFAKNEYQAPHGMIDLAHCTTVKSADWKSKKRHSFEISTPEITYLLYADTESEKDDWIGRVGKAIVRCSRTYVGKKGTQGQPRGGGGYHGQQHLGDSDEEDDDDIYTNDDMENPYYND